MRISKLVILAFASILFTSCSKSYTIFSDQESGVNFSSYETFTLLNHKDGFPVGANPINKQRINRAVYDGMVDMGFKESSNPDLLVTWFVKVEEKGVMDYYRDFYGRWRDFNQSNIYYYKEGTLVIDIIDRKNKQVIWHGKTSDRVYEGMKNVEEKINDAVKSMYKKYRKDTKNSRDFATTPYQFEEENFALAEIK